MTEQQIVQATLAIARGEVGTREIGNTNRGRKVDEYQRADLLPGEGYPWCSSFEAWRMLVSLGPELCDKVWHRSASCDQVLAFGRRVGIVSDKPVLGAMGLVMASRHDATHIFHVDEMDRDAVFTIEGNTNEGGSRNGNGVYRRRRVLSSRYLYLHWMKRLPKGATLRGQIELPEVKVPASPFEDCPNLDLILGGRVVAIVPSLHGRTWVQARKWARWMGTTISWQVATQSVLIAGREVPAQPILLEGNAWLPVTKLAAHSGLKAEFDPANRRVEVKR